MNTIWMGSWFLLPPPPLLCLHVLCKLHLSCSQHFIDVLCTMGCSIKSSAESTPKWQRKVMSLEEEVKMPDKLKQRMSAILHLQK